MGIAHRPGGRERRPLHGARGPSRRTDRGGRARWADPRLAGDADACSRTRRRTCASPSATSASSVSRTSIDRSGCTRRPRMGCLTSFPPVRGDVRPHDAGAGASVASTARAWVAARRRRPRARRALPRGAAPCEAIPAGGLGGVQPNHVGLIDPATNEIVAEIPVGIRPGPVAAGEGSVWVGNLEDRTLTRIDPVERTADSDDPSRRIGHRRESRSDLDAVWVAHGLRGERVARRPPVRAGDGVDRPWRAPPSALPNGSVAVGRAARSGPRSVTRRWHVSTPKDELRRTRRWPVPQPAGVAAAPGSVWVANSGDATVQRLPPGDLRAGSDPHLQRRARNRPESSTPSGAIWVANAGGDIVTRIEPSSGAIVARSRSETVPRRSPAVPEPIWVANAGGQDRLAHRPARRTRSSRRSRSGTHRPASPFSEGFVWVAAQPP